jgi:hypothetical protein
MPRGISTQFSPYPPRLRKVAGIPPGGILRIGPCPQPMTAPVGNDCSRGQRSKRFCGGGWHAPLRIGRRPPRNILQRITRYGEYTLYRDKETVMAAHSGEIARETGDFTCKDGDESVHVEKWHRIPKCRCDATEFDSRENEPKNPSTPASHKREHAAKKS